MAGPKAMKRVVQQLLCVPLEGHGREGDWQPHPLREGSPGPCRGAVEKPAFDLENGRELSTREREGRCETGTGERDRGGGGGSVCLLGLPWWP